MISWSTFSSEEERLFVSIGFVVKAEIGKYKQQMLPIKKSDTFTMSASSAIYNASIDRSVLESSPIHTEVVWCVAERNSTGGVKCKSCKSNHCGLSHSWEEAKFGHDTKFKTWKKK